VANEIAVAIPQAGIVRVLPKNADEIARNGSCGGCGESL
jgi:hypothetical protein